MSNIVCERNGNTVYVRDLRGNTIDTLSFGSEVSDASSFGNGLTVRTGSMCHTYELQNGHLVSAGMFSSSAGERHAQSASSVSSDSKFCGNDATDQLQRKFRKYQLWERIKEEERDEREDRILDALERTQNENAKMRTENARMLAENAKTRTENEQLKEDLTGLQRDLLKVQDDLLEVQEKQCKAEIARAKIDAWNFGRKYGIASGKEGHLCRPQRDIPFSFMVDLEPEVEESAIEGYEEGYSEGVKSCTLSDDEVSNIRQEELEHERIIAEQIRKKESEEREAKRKRREAKRKRREEERKWREEEERMAREAAERTRRAQERRKQAAEYRRRKAVRTFLINAFTVVGAFVMIISLFRQGKQQFPLLSVVGLVWRTCVYVLGLLAGIVAFHDCWTINDDALKWGVIGLCGPLWLCASYYPICERYGFTRSIGMTIQTFKSKNYKKCWKQFCDLWKPMMWTVLIALGMWVMTVVIIPYGRKTTMWREACEQRGLCTTFCFFTWIGIVSIGGVWQCFNNLRKQ